MFLTNLHSANDWFEVLQTTDRSQTAIMNLGPGDASGETMESHDESDQVLLVIEGKAAGDALGRKAAAVDAAIIGIVDQVDYEDAP